MTQLLRIDASARIQGSYSRDLGDKFQSRWLDRAAGRSVVVRDLGTQPVAQIGQATITGFYAAESEITPALLEATALSDELIAELQSADELLLTVPIYNFSIPASLKCWIDQVVRIRHTFSYDGASFSGLVSADRATVIVTYGASGYLNGGPLSHADFAQPYLAFLLRFLGLSDVRFIGMEATTGELQTISQNTADAEAEICALLKE